MPLSETPHLGNLVWSMFYLDFQDSCFGGPDTQGAPEEVRGYPYIRLGPRYGGNSDFLTVFDNGAGRMG
jgi:hypothetical protein